MTLKVVQIHDTNFREVTATLRTIADEIDAGTYGTVGNVSLVLLGDRLEVFSMGPDSDSTSAVCVLQAGANKLLQPFLEHGQ